MILFSFISWYRVTFQCVHASCPFQAHTLRDGGTRMHAKCFQTFHVALLGILLITCQGWQIVDGTIGVALAGMISAWLTGVLVVDRCYISVDDERLGLWDDWDAEVNYLWRMEERHWSDPLSRHKAQCKAQNVMYKTGLKRKMKLKRTKKEKEKKEKKAA